MASVRDIKIAEEFDIDEIGALAMAFTDMGYGYSFHVFSVIWLDGLQGYFSCCSLLILLCNKHNKAEYEAHQLISVPIRLEPIMLL